MYSVQERDAARDHILAMASSDPRIVAAAAVGSLALGGGDRWSDLDLTFAVADEVPVSVVLEAWTGRVGDDLGGVALFDLPSGETTYRVFLLPGGLQVDLSFTPAAAFRPGGPRFRLLFGEAGEPRTPQRPLADDLFGWGVAYVRDARACIERGRPWQAEHCIRGVLDRALTLACLRLDLPTSFGRGYDDLPRDVLAGLEAARPPSLDREALMAGLRVATEALLREASGLPAARSVEPWVRALVEGTDEAG